LLVTLPLGQPVDRVIIAWGGRSPEALAGFTEESKNELAPIFTDMGLEVVCSRIDNEGFPEALLQFKARAKQRGITDVVFPVALGEGGEDGKLQGFLETVGIPYVGSGVRASALLMDKLATKDVCRSLGLSSPRGYLLPYRFPAVPSYPAPLGHTPSFREIATSMNADMLVAKLRASGGSIGLTMITNERELQRVIDVMQRYDSDILLEEYIQPRVVSGMPVEYSVSLLGWCPEVLPVCEIRHSGALLSTQAKNPENDIDQGASCVEHTFDVSLDDESIKRMKEQAVELHLRTGCHFMSRMDFIVGTTGKIFLLEGNTLPGLLPRSVYRQACEHAGLDIYDVLLRLLESAFVPRH